MTTDFGDEDEEVFFDGQYRSVRSMLDTIVKNLIRNSQEKYEQLVKRLVDESESDRINIHQRLDELQRRIEELEK